MMRIVLEVLSDYVDTEEVEITGETELVKDLKLTSYDRISLLGDLERRLGYEIPEEEIAQIISIADVVAFLEKRN